MKAWTLARAALAAGFISAPVMAAPAAQPPMNAFRQAFYNCDDNAAFGLAYDAIKPKAVTMTTSGDNKEYALKRSPGPALEFADAGAKLTLDGDAATVEGTATALKNCKRKT